MKKRLLMLLLASIPTLFFGQRTKVSFLSNAANIREITEPDTKAAALYVESFYETDFKRLVSIILQLISNTFQGVVTVDIVA